MLTFRFQEEIYPRHFLLNFYQWIKSPLINAFKSSKNMFKNSLFCGVFSYPNFMHNDFKS
jgi:hypothetical protein